MFFVSAPSTSTYVWLFFFKFGEIDPCFVGNFRVLIQLLFLQPTIWVFFFYFWEIRSGFEYIIVSCLRLIFREYKSCFCIVRLIFHEYKSCFCIIRLIFHEYKHYSVSHIRFHLAPPSCSFLPIPNHYFKVKMKVLI